MIQRIVSQLKTGLTDYQSVPFWSWNDKLEPEELKKQIHWMKDNGIGGFFMHARGGLKTEYMSDEWMHCIDVCCEEAKKLGMHAWAYDENGWPSGFAGGKLLEDMENRDRYLLSEIGAYDENAYVSYVSEGDELQRVSKGEDGKLYLNLYMEYSASTVDILNPQVVEQFLALTHETYKAHMREAFSDNLKGFFTDEPQFYRWHTAYTPMIATYFRERYGEDILDRLGLLFVEKEGYREFRYRYWCGMQKLMLENFAKKIYKWCEENGVQFTGHYIEENSMGFQDICCGGVMPFYQYMHIPGMDWLGRETKTELGCRQLGSVARQMGKKHVLTETFACCGWDVTPGELRRIAGFQYVNGVNKMCQHLLPYSEAGVRKRDHPEHFTPLNPWVKENFKDFNDYFTRLGYLLGEGKEEVRVAMLHPQRSTYFDYKREEGDEGGEMVEALDAALKQACRLLSAKGIQYHFLDETLLEEHGYVKSGQIGCGRCTYDYLVIPRIITMGKETEGLLRQYVEQGGKILLLDNKPQYLEGHPYEYSYLNTNCTLEDMEQEQPFQVTDTENELYYAYREIDGQAFLYVQNASEKESYTQTFRFADKIRSFMELDLVTLKTRQLPLTVTFHENEGRLLFLSEMEAPELTDKQEVEITFHNAEVTFEKNWMTLNIIQYSKDGIHYSEPMYRSVMFQHLLEQRYEGRLWLRYTFEVQTLPEELVLLSEWDSVKRTQINDQSITFTETLEEDGRFCTADITNLVHVGQNYYESILDWHQSEATYYALFGENVTETLKNCVVYECDIEAVYLTGKFGVYSHQPLTTFDSETVCGCDFYIGEVPKCVSELTADGFPFFRGKLSMKQTFTLEETQSILNIKGHYLTAKVILNGQTAQANLFGRRVDVSDLAVIGDNELEVEFTIGNRNFFGPFHSTESDRFLAPLHFDVCDLSRSKDGKLQYRLRLFYETDDR